MKHQESVQGSLCELIPSFRKIEGSLVGLFFHNDILDIPLSDEIGDASAFPVINNLYDCESFSQVARKQDQSLLPLFSSPFQVSNSNLNQNFIVICHNMVNHEVSKVKPHRYLLSVDNLTDTLIEAIELTNINASLNRNHLNIPRDGIYQPKYNGSMECVDFCNDTHLAIKVNEFIDHLIDHAPNVIATYVNDKDRISNLLSSRISASICKYIESNINSVLKLENVNFSTEQLTSLVEEELKVQYRTWWETVSARPDNTVEIPAQVKFICPITKVSVAIALILKVNGKLKTARNSIRPFFEFYVTEPGVTIDSFEL